MTKKSNRALEQNLSFKPSNNCITFTLSALWLVLERKYCITCTAEAYRSLCPGAVGGGGWCYHFEFEITLIRQGAGYTPLSPGREGWRG